MKKIIGKICAALASKYFFIAVLIFFVLEALWIALSAAYPQAFDENFHFGLIKIYSHHWLPFLGQQPTGGDAFGAVARDPSYLFHYLMSFPYRLVAVFIHSQIGQIIALRIIDIALFTSGLALFHRVVRKAGLSKILANLTIFVIAFLPVVPQLAGQINYDNLLFPLVAIVSLLTFRLIDEAKSGQPTSRTLLLLIITCLFSTMVKYAFLPIFLAVVAFLAVFLLYKSRSKPGKLWKSLQRDWRRQSAFIKILLICALLIGLGLFVQREGVNFVKYHSLSPDCAKVLTDNQCQAYPVWRHDHRRHVYVQNHPDIHFYNIVQYTGEWLYWMWYRLLFAVNGPHDSFRNYPPLPLPAIGLLLIIVLGLFALVKAGRRTLQGNLYLQFLLLAAICYTAILFADGYKIYRQTGVLELMNGRYLLPVLPMLAAIIGRAASLAFKQNLKIKVAIAITMIILFLEGGGVFNFIMRSDHKWDIQNQTVISVNDKARQILRPVLVVGRKQYSTDRWYLFNGF